jgi:hypothetical protein
MKIETDVPLPESSRARKYPFLEMSVGESVYFEGEEVNGRAYRAAMSTGRRHNQKYVARRTIKSMLPADEDNVAIEDPSYIWSTKRRVMSKGSRPRPLSVSQEKFDDNFDRIFGKKANIETLTIRVSGTTAHGSTLSPESTVLEISPKEQDE